jgi:molybdopterin-synthase adenylyltransferase
MDGHIRLGSGLFGIAAEIADPSGRIWELLEAMNGSRTIAEIVEVMSPSERTQVTAPQIMDTIEALFTAGHLEDASSLEPEALSPRERERYSRGHAYFRWVDTLPRKGSWDVQLRLRDARVVVVGAGGAAAQGLAASGVGHLHCVDSDIVELSNLNRQVLYNEDDLGKPKVDAASPGWVG